MKKEITIGSIIRQKVEESPLTIQEFADRINLHRTSVYHLFTKETIDIERLKQISEVLGYDFINEIYQKQDADSDHPKQPVFTTIEIDAEILQKLNLPDDFLLLIKKRK